MLLKRIDNDHELLFFFFSETFRVIKYMFLDIFLGPGGFRELLESCWNHSHLSWYLSDSVVPSCDQKSGGTFFSSAVDF